MLAFLTRDQKGDQFGLIADGALSVTETSRTIRACIINHAFQTVDFFIV